MCCLNAHEFMWFRSWIFLFYYLKYLEIYQWKSTNKSRSTNSALYLSLSYRVVESTVFRTLFFKRPVYSLFLIEVTCQACDFIYAYHEKYLTLSRKKSSWICLHELIKTRTKTQEKHSCSPQECVNFSPNRFLILVVSTCTSNNNLNTW